MSKGTFDTPRSTGTVDEIRINSVKIRLRTRGNPPVTEFHIDAELHEGNVVSGDFEVSETGTVHVTESGLSPADRAFLNNFMKVILQEYVNVKGYSGVVIS